ncbi:alpha/beta hydrolase [Pontiellaceae bacterium B12227]|nr:alpha/beta hydrolase [Pontiellaceae bacterium B12227]
MKKTNGLLVAAAVSMSWCGMARALEPLKESTEAYVKLVNDRYLAKADKNGNGKIEKEEEDEKQWRRNKALDKNGDGALDAEELKERTLKYVTSGGKQLRDVRYKRTPTEDVYLDFYFPDVDESKKKPVVLYTHGGGWAAGSRHGAGNASFDVVHKALLKQGFCVVSVGYRLWRKEGGTAMRDCVIDAMDALRYISAYQKELGIDPNRMYTFGDSAGGHLAQMVLLVPPDSLTGDPELAKYSYKTVAGVSWYGPCDFEKTSLFNHDDRENFRDRFGPRILLPDTDPKDKLALYQEMSPINYLSKKSPPLLMIQGDKDTTIPVKHAYYMQEKAADVGAPVEIMIIKNAGHNFRKVDADIDPSRNEIIARTISFFVAHRP